MLADSFKAYEQALAKVKETGGAPPAGHRAPARRSLILLGACCSSPRSSRSRRASIGRARPRSARRCPSPAAWPCATPPATAIAPARPPARSRWRSPARSCSPAWSRRRARPSALKYVAGLPEHTIAIEPGPNAAAAADGRRDGLPGASVLTLKVPLGAKEPNAPAGHARRRAARGDGRGPVRRAAVLRPRARRSRSATRPASRSPGWRRRPRGRAERLGTRSRRRLRRARDRRRHDRDASTPVRTRSSCPATSSSARRPIYVAAGRADAGGRRRAARLGDRPRPHARQLQREGDADAGRRRAAARAGQGRLRAHRRRRRTRRATRSC